MDGGAAERWSAVARVWSELWSGFAEPVWLRIADVARVGPGSRVLDVGCGSGELLAFMAGLGAATAGVDPAPAMVELARAAGGDVRTGSFARLPCPDGVFDVVTAVNSLQFADDTDDALAELTRVTRPGGHVAVANWAEAARNDLDTIEVAIAAAAGDEVRDGGDLRAENGLESLFTDGGLDVVWSGLVELVWTAPGDDALVRGVLMGEDADVVAATAPTVLAAARPFRTPHGGYRLVNAFRLAIGRTPDRSGPGTATGSASVHGTVTP